MMRLITRDHASSRKRTGTNSSETVVRIEGSKRVGDVAGMASDTGRQTRASRPVLARAPSLGASLSSATRSSRT